MHGSLAQPLALLASSWCFACSSSEAPANALTLAPIYHLRAVDGAVLPIAGADMETLDSGTFRRAGGDTIVVDDYSHSPPSGGNPGITVVGVGSWVATQFGNTIVLFPAIANSQDTAFLSGGDTLTLHTRAGGTRAFHIKVYVSP